MLIGGLVTPLALPAHVAAIRLTANLAPRVALDLDVGTAVGAGYGFDQFGRVFAGQMRWLWHGRAPNGSSSYWLTGPLFIQGTSRTEIRFPGRTVFREEDSPIRALQIGYGVDRITRNGVRGGVELKTGGGEGPVIFLNMFLQWGK